jgi:uncharacterized iron-regulated protein
MKRILKITFALLIVSIFSAFKSDKPAYLLFNQKGKKVKYQRMLQTAAKADVVFFGELHNNPISHWLQLELTQDLFKHKDGKIILGAEMFEADNQEALNAYLKNEIDRDSLKNAARLWPNYKTDIEPLVHFARDNQLPFIATNIPRRYASMVFRQGFEVLDTLSEQEKSWMAPLPMAYDPQLPGYLKMLEMMSGHAHGMKAENFPKAQAVKDATMAWFIHQHFEEGKCFVHYNGAFHTDNFEGIIWYLKLLRPEIKIMTISTIEITQPLQLPEESAGIADFIIGVPETMTKTH